MKTLKFVSVFILATFLTSCSNSKENQLVSLKEIILELQDDIENLKQALKLKNSKIEDLEKEMELITSSDNELHLCEDVPTEIFHFSQDNKQIYVSKYYGIGFIFHGELNQNFKMLESAKCGFGIYYVRDIIEPVKTFKVSNGKTLLFDDGTPVPVFSSLKENLLLYDTKWIMVNVSNIEYDIWNSEINPLLETIEFEFVDIIYNY